MHAPRRILVIAPSSGDHVRQELLCGIAEHRGPERSFQVQFSDPDPASLARQLGRRPDGVIVLAPAARPSIDGLPLVLVNGTKPDDHPYHVTTDEAALARVAVAHLRERGFARIAWIGELAGTEHRQLAVLDALGGGAVPIPLSWRQPPEALVGELQALLPTWRTPLALIVYNSFFARRLVDILVGLGVAIPDEVAVLGFDDDLAFCQLAARPISAVRTPHRAIGSAAMALLERLMAGERVPEGPLLLPPSGVTVRRSTDALAIADPLVADAIRWIRAHADEPITVTAVATAFNLNRRTLAVRFQAACGHGVLDEIQRAHVTIAQDLLSGHPEWDLSRIALASGLNDRWRLNRTFQDLTGQTPTAWRTQLGT